MDPGQKHVRRHNNLETLIQLAISGLAMGLIYCLVAIEFTLILNTSGLMNFGHDKYIMFGAFLFGGTFVIRLGWDFLPSAVASVLLMGVVGIFIAVIVFSPLQKLPRVYAMTGTMALSMILQEATRLTYGARSFTVLGFLSGTINFGFVSIQRVYLFIIIVTTILLIFQNLLMMKTKLGRSFRAVAQDKETSSLMGINVNTMLIASATMSLLICGIIGVLIIPVTGITLGMSNMIGSKGYIAGVVGGMGSLNGAIIGGLVVGLTEALFLAFGGNPVYKDVVSFVLVVLFLLLKPDGILSEKKAAI